MAEKMDWEEEVTKEEEEDEGDMSSEDEEEEGLQKAKQAITCRSVTLNTLMEDDIIQPGQGVLSIDYLGQRFEADLLPSGKIKWQGSEEEFGTPSAWALHCKRLVNPIKRSGCGWASVKYNNKKLDIWKSIWARRHRPNNPHKTPGTAGHSPVKQTTPPSTAPSTPVQATDGQPTQSPPTTTPSASTTSPTPTATSTATTVSSVTCETKSEPTSSSSSQISPNTANKTTKVSEENGDGVKKPDKLVVESEPASSLKISTNDNKGEKDVTNSTVSKANGNVKKDKEKRSSNETPLNLSTPPTSVGSENIPPSFGKTKTREGVPVITNRVCVPYTALGTRGLDIDPQTLVLCEQFDSHNKLQPFTVSINTNALLLMDFHCHLTQSEVIGYLGGRWDTNKQHLSVEQVFPVCCRLEDRDRGPLIEEEIRRSMRQRHMMVVGWYHSHPRCEPHPSVRDVDKQMSHQLNMRTSGSMYLPCLGFIVSPFEIEQGELDSWVQAFWVMPNLEDPTSYNIPMQVSYNILRDSSLTEDVLADIKRLTDYYSGVPDKVALSERWRESITYLEKTRASLTSKLPEDQLDSGTFLDYVQQLLLEMK